MHAAIERSIARLSTGVRAVHHGPQLFRRCSRQGVLHGLVKALNGHSGIYSIAAIDSTSLKAHRPAASAKGAFVQSIGRSRGGLTTKIRGLVDDDGRPKVLLLSAGNANEIPMAPALVETAGPLRRLLADNILARVLIAAIFSYWAKRVRTLAKHHGQPHNIGFPDGRRTQAQSAPRCNRRVLPAS